jgi:hypothetical protein
MKAWHFLQVSSEIIGKHRHRSDVTRMTSSTDLQIAVTSTTNVNGTIKSHLARYEKLTVLNLGCRRLAAHDTKH